MMYEENTSLEGPEDLGKEHMMGVCIHSYGGGVRICVFFFSLLFVFVGLL